MMNSITTTATTIRLLIKLLLATSIITTAASLALTNNQQHNPYLSQISTSSKITKRHNNQDAQDVQSKVGTQQQQQQAHFAPKLIHQPQSILVKPNEPHTVECAIESVPEAEIKWFKDDQLLGLQPTHLEQQGSELIFVQMNEDDTGEYRCQATNYLGSISSEPFRLTVHSSVHEPRIRFEPKLAETGPDQMVELTCNIPIEQTEQQQTSAKNPSSAVSVVASASALAAQAEIEVSWRKNGRKLSVEWLDEGEDMAASVRSRFVGRQIGPSQFLLTILRTQLTDDNSTFTCLYKLQQQQQQQDDQSSLARESSPILLRVYRPTSVYPINNTNLGTPIEGLANAKPPTDHLAHQNHTTILAGSTTTTTSISDSASRGGIKSIQETLRALFEVAKPVLSIVGVLALVGLLVGLQLIYMRRRNSGCCCSQSNRYMKHHHHQYSSSSSATSACTSSAGSSSITTNNGGTGGSATSQISSSTGSSGILDRDPVLSSLLGRTLSAPSCAGVAAAAATAAAAAATLAGGSKKYRSYRDHMRKVAAVNETIDDEPVMSHTDLVDSYLAQLANGGNHPNLFQHQHYHQQQQQQQLHLPNLYNQSLAAREQARSLLQTSEHMRSLNNLNLNQNNKHLQQQQQQHQHQRNKASGVSHQFNGSHLNLPLSFANFSRNNNNSNNNNNNKGPLTTTTTTGEQHSSALWPNHLKHFSQARGQQQQQPPVSYDEHSYQLVDCSLPGSVSPSTSSSIAGSNNQSSAQLNRNPNEQHSRQNNANHYSTIETENDEEYEELDQHQHRHHQQQQQPKVSASNSSSKRISSFSITQDQPDPSLGGVTKRAQHYPDQPSPYAVSSICNNSMSTNQTSAAPAPPPPVDSEAMQALSEQFNINQWLLDENNRDSKTFANQQLPPPPPAPPSSKSTPLKPPVNDATSEKQAAAKRKRHR